VARKFSPYDSFFWTTQLAELLESAPLESVWDYVLDVLHDRFTISSLGVVLYSGDTMPEAKFYRAMDDPEGKRIEAYLHGAYLLDPFFDAVQKSRMSGCYALAEVAPDGFRDGQYYKTFFTKYGLVDEVDLFFSPNSLQTVAISFGRGAGARQFGARSLSFLSSATEFLGRLAERSVIDESRLLAGLDRRVRAQFHDRQKLALENAGKSLLSPREKEVLDYSLRGFSAKVTADRLRVTEGTVRLHRHNLYAKLDVTSQSELFALVLQALTDFGVNDTEDPLAALIASRGDIA
jgi:DNA-binding CsgD family transcriptional regulator